MNKKIVFMLFFISMLFLNSCSLIGGRMGIFDDSDTKADARMDQVIGAIKSKDREALKSLFSSKALDEAIDIDDGIDYLFYIIKGTVKSWKRNSSSGSEDIRDGKTTKMIRSHYNVITDEDEYYFFIVEYTKDDSNPDNIGVFMIQATKREDMNNLPSWQDSLCGGIYKPEE